MIRARTHALIQSARLTLKIQRAREREQDALTRAGEEIAASACHVSADACQPVLAEIRRLRAALDAHAGSLAGSYEADRRDYLAVAKWMRPLVVLRGVCARALLRHCMSHARHSLGPLHRQLAAAALADSGAGSAALPLTPLSADAVRAARADVASLTVEHTRILEPFGGRAYPGWVGVAVDEIVLFSRALLSQLRGQLIPKTSALAGLAAGWWVTHTYTDSRSRSVLRSLGIGSGGAHVVNGHTYRTMRFWLPLLAAAVCAYLGDRLARWIQRRYHPAAPASGQAPAETMTHHSVPT